MTLAYVQDGETLTIPCPAAGSTVAVWLAVGGITGQALKTTTSGLDLEVYCPEVGDVVRLTKATGFAPAAGDVAYFDISTDNRLEAFAAEGTTIVPVGFYAAAAVSGDTAARVVWDPARAEQALEVHRLRLPFTANDVTTASFRARRAGKIVGISYYTTGKPSSAAGTILLTSKNVGVSDNALFSSTDLEGLTDNAMTAITLTATAADLVFAQAGLAEFIVTSNHSDGLENDGVDLYIHFQRT